MSFNLSRKPIDLLTMSVVLAGLLRKTKLIEQGNHYILSEMAAFQILRLRLSLSISDQV